MRYFFYNSFTLGSGYKYAELKDNVICSTDIPIDIDCDFCNGGCQLVVRNTSTTSILILKGILYVNDQKKFDEQGRKVYINLAVEATIAEHKILNNVFYAIIAEWKNLCRYLGESVKIPYPNSIYGYGIEEKRINSLIRYFSQYNTEPIKRELGNERTSLNAIVLKSSDYSYYETLAKDLYKSKNKSLKVNFIQQNIISGEVFAKFTSAPSTKTYDEFILEIDKLAMEVSDIEKFESDNSIDKKTNASNSQEDNTDGNDITDLMTSKNTNKDSQGSLITHTKNNKTKELSLLCQKTYKKMRPHFKFIIGFACGFLLGYLIGK